MCPSLGSKSAKQEMLTRLRRDVAACCQPSDPVQGVGLGPGLPVLEKAAVHEVMAADPRDYWAAMGFALGLGLRVAGTNLGGIIWGREAYCGQERGIPYAPGLWAFGLMPERLVLVCPQKNQDLLWVLEEALRCPGVGLVVAELAVESSVYGLTQSRRLQLAAQAAEKPLILVRGAGASQPSAARSRWCVEAYASRAVQSRGEIFEGVSAPGLARWRCRLERSKAKAADGEADWRRQAVWEVEWDHETHSFRLVTEMADRPLAPVAAREGTRTVLPFAKTG